MESKEKDERERRKDERAMRMLKERTNTQINQKRKEAEIRKSILGAEKDVAGEKRKLMNSAKDMFREAGYSGLSTSCMGRVLGEIEQ